MKLVQTKGRGCHLRDGPDVDDPVQLSRTLRGRSSVRLQADPVLYMFHLHELVSHQLDFVQAGAC